MIVIPYSAEYEQLWDEFIDKKSMNGTFLHSRRFLNYHGTEKFSDCSIIIGNNFTDIWAVIPACERQIDGKKAFFSHMGSTYGGLVINKIRYNLLDMIDILDSLDEYLKEQKYNEVILKMTPDIFSLESSDLCQYLLSYKGFSNYTELSTYIDYPTYGDDVLVHMNNARRRKIKKCFAAELSFKMISSDSEIEAFYKLLLENLAKHGVKPVHTLPELLEFRNSRLPEVVDFYGVFMQEEMIAGAMSFNFKNANVLHIQYSAAKQELEKLTPMSFLFYNLINHGIKNGFSRLSWGISTEQQGRILNQPLAQTKESYGSKFTLNRTFYKEL